MKLLTTLKSRAKINLFLHVNDKLKNGYHELESLFYFPDIFDEIEIYESGMTSIEVVGEFSEKLNSSSSQNLILIVYNSLKAAFAEKIPNLHFKLKKNLPIAAGIGGGSGNAAVVMKFLNESYNLGLGEFQLIELAKKIGADVPPSLYEQPCLVSGIGEKLDFNVKLPELNILLVNPLKEVSTQKVFEAGSLEFVEKLNNVQYSFENASDLVDFLIAETTNSLHGNAVAICPEIKEVEKLLRGQCGCLMSRMSGSGGTVFGIFDNCANLKLSFDNLRGEYPYYFACTSSG